MMQSIALIGTSHLEEDILLPTFAVEKRNAGKIRISYGGTMRNCAHSLALMGFPVSFMTKLGNDMDGIQIWSQLNGMNVHMFGPTIDLPTPKKTVLYPDNENVTVIWDRPEAFFFHPGDSIPAALFNRAGISVTDIQDNEVLRDLTLRTPDTHWIISHFVPDREVLKRTYGLVIRYGDALSLGKPSDFERICYRLCALGPRFVVISMNSQGVYVYSGQRGRHFPSKWGPAGCRNGVYSAFLSGLVAGLALNAPLDTCADIATTAEALTYQCEDLVNPRIRYLFRKKK